MPLAHQPTGFDAPNQHSIQPLPPVNVQIDERILRSSEYKQYRNVGKALIISNVEYRQKGARSDRKNKDAIELAKLFFEELKFEPVTTRVKIRDQRDVCSDFETRQIHRDVTKDDLIQLTKDASDENLNNYTDFTSFVCIILSYGWGSLICCPGGPSESVDTFVNMNELLGCFTGDKCPSLVLKPKIFLVQSCPAFDEITADTFSAGPRPAYHPPTFMKLPSHADFIVQRSSLPGTWGWGDRDCDKMSYFANGLRNMIRKYWKDKEKPLEFQRILLRVNRFVTEKLDENGAVTEKYGMSTTVSTLTKDLYFPSGIEYT